MARVSPDFVRQVRRKCAGGIQLLACACFLLFSLAPMLLSATGTNSFRKQCTGDHRLCGCSPHRVASRTCCCYQAPECCRAENQPVAAAATGLTSLPCGREATMLLSFQDLHLLVPAGPLERPVIGAGTMRFHGLFRALPELSLPPPVPPPRSLSHV